MVVPLRAQGEAMGLRARLLALEVARVINLGELLHQVRKWLN
eukprot:COSAG01_NODE_3920_length_5536_cov_14.374655_3_plen_42_part_00